MNLTQNLAFVKPILNEMPCQFVGLCYIDPCYGQLCLDGQNDAVCNKLMPFVTRGSKA